MNGTTKTIEKVSERQLRMWIKESVKESVSAEFLKLRAALLPYVSQDEQKDIERLYGKPRRGIAKSYDIKV